MSKGRLGRREKGPWLHNDTTNCYGCGKPFKPDMETRAREVLCAKCIPGSEPEATNAWGVITGPEPTRRTK